MQTWGKPVIFFSMSKSEIPELVGSGELKTEILSWSFQVDFKGWKLKTEVLKCNFRLRYGMMTKF